MVVSTWDGADPLCTGNSGGGAIAPEMKGQNTLQQTNESTDVIECVDGGTYFVQS